MDEAITAQWQDTGYDLTIQVPLCSRAAFGANGQGPEPTVATTVVQLAAVPCRGFGGGGRHQHSFIKDFSKSRLTNSAAYGPCRDVKGRDLKD